MTGNLDTNRRELTAGQKKVIKNLSCTAGKAGEMMEYPSENRPAWEKGTRPYDSCVEPDRMTTI